MSDGSFRCENCDADLLDGGGYLMVDVLDRTVHVNDPGRTHQRRSGEPIHTVYVCDHDCRQEWWAESRWSDTPHTGWCTLDTREDNDD